MPYINSERKKALWSESNTDYNNRIENAGELNYFITTIVLEYLEYKGVCYQTMNDISGALTESLAEFRRKIVVPYEIKKAKSNGDVYLKKSRYK